MKRTVRSIFLILVFAPKSSYFQQEPTAENKKFVFTQHKPKPIVAILFLILARLSDGVFTIIGCYIEATVTCDSGVDQAGIYIPSGIYTLIENNTPSRNGEASVKVIARFGEDITFNFYCYDYQNGWSQTVGFPTLDIYDDPATGYLVTVAGQVPGYPYMEQVVATCVEL